MSTKHVIAVIVIILATVSFATAKRKDPEESIQFQVVSSKTALHGRPPNVFTYTQAIFVEIGGKKLVYSCDVRGDECPLMESGKTYTANQAGNDIYFTMPVPDTKRTFEVKYKQIGVW